MQYKQLPQLRMASSAKLSIKKIKQLKKNIRKGTNQNLSSDSSKLTVALKEQKKKWRLLNWC